ncbi:MAG: hypothetical protein AAF280_01330 [Pseudomonadota bacterium]
MTQTPEQTDQKPGQNADQSPGPKPRKSRLKRAAIWVTGSTMVLCVLAVIGLMSLVGNRIALPEWARAQISERINGDIDGMALAFGDLSILVEDDWMPQLAMQNVVISDAVGTPLVQLSDVQTTTGLGGIWEGELRPSTIRLAGIQLLVRRDADGQINFQLGGSGGTASDGRAAGIDGFIDWMDRFASRDRYAQLSRVSVENLAIRYEDARSGQAWNVDGGQIDFTRDGNSLVMDADLTLLGNRGFATTMGMSLRSDIGSGATDMTFTFEDMPAQDIAGQAPALSWLRALDAPISGGLSAQLDENGELGPMAASLDIAAGTLSPNDAAKPIAFDHAGAQLTYDPVTSIMNFERLAVTSQWITTQIEGQTRLHGMEDGLPDALTSQFKASVFEANPFSIYDTPIALDDARLDMRLTLDPFRVELGELAITDQGRHIHAQADIAAGDDGWAITASAMVPGIAPDRLLELWPETLEPKTRKWITNNVRDVDLKDIKFAINMQPSAKPNIYLGFDFENLASQFIKNVPIIENGRGTGMIQGKQFAIAAHGGVVIPPDGGPIDISGSTFEIKDILIRGGEGEVQLRTDSSVTAALSLLNSGPFGFIDKAGQSVTVADGRARLSGQLNFPVIDRLTFDGVDFSMTGEVTEVTSDQLVPGRVLKSAKLTVDATPERLALGGPGQVGDVPFEGLYTMPLSKGSNGRASVEGWIELSQRFMDEFKIGLPPGSVGGAGRGDITLNLERDTPATFSMTSDLAGLSLALVPLDWSIGETQTGELSVSGSLGQPPAIDSLTLDAGGLRATGSVTLEPDGQLQQANFSRVRLSNWIDAPVDLVGLGPGQAPLIRVPGGTVDLRKTSLTRKQGRGGQGGGPVSLRLDRLQIADAITLTDFNAELSTARGVSGDFTGQINGGTAIAGRIVPQAGGSAFQITSQDAGGVLASANLLKQARDGQMELVLVPGQGEGVYEGQFTATRLRVKDMPTMAALLNAISLVGILDQMNGDGIHFSEVNGRFQLAPDRVTIYEVAAVGASMGISMEGYYYGDRKWLDLDGVISPVYALNLGGWFGRPGEGLIGFGYDVEGPASDPKVEVDPLSILTPGMFRDLFRGPPPARPGEASRDDTSTTTEQINNRTGKQADR